MNRPVADIVADSHRNDPDTYRCCTHCADDLPHIEPNTHDLPCDICVRAEAVVVLERLDSLRLTCPTCVGSGWIVVGQTMGFPAGEQNQCPDCTDGRMSWEWMVAIVSRVTELSDQSQLAGADTSFVDYLRSVRP